MLQKSLLKFYKLESAVGISLIIATVLAMILANSTFFSYYSTFIDTPVVVSIGKFEIAKPLLLWINDGLMAVFFFMIGLEVKREVLEGNLNKIDKISLPLFAAIGGMVVPALIYTFFNYGDENAMKGWAIPAATDIAFALGILSLLGNRVPASLKVFLLALAIIDDLGAIIIIALFYTSEISTVSLYISAIAITAMFIMNKKGVVNHTLYILIGIVLWTAVLKSGVHATLAGVAVGLLIPLKNNRTAFYNLEHSLHAPVNFVILPIFAFANAGVTFSGVSAKDFTDNVTLGITFGLLLGKQMGVFLFSALAIFLKLGKLPNGVTWGHLYGVSILSGIGFTMSLFIGSLAFECSNGVCFDMVDERMGIIIGSLLSGIAGYLVLKSQQKQSKA
ncbi:MAG: Na+/H+ antiporter NhaA [Campylobacterota bacterium]|nr:Na+/H+ antiporter NhaA [Campylobacterota bacterium]